MPPFYWGFKYPAKYYCVSCVCLFLRSGFEWTSALIAAFHWKRPIAQISKLSFFFLMFIVTCIIGNKYNPSILVLFFLSRFFEALYRCAFANISLMVGSLNNKMSRLLSLSLCLPGSCYQADRDGTKILYCNWADQEILSNQNNRRQENILGRWMEFHPLTVSGQICDRCPIRRAPGFVVRQT